MKIITNIKVLDYAFTKNFHTNSVLKKQIKHRLTNLFKSETRVFDVEVVESFL